MSAVKNMTTKNPVRTSGAVVASLAGAAAFFLGSASKVQNESPDKPVTLQHRHSMESMYGTADGNFPSATQGARLSNAPGVKSPRYAHAHNKSDSGIAPRWSINRRGEPVQIKPKSRTLKSHNVTVGLEFDEVGTRWSIE